MWLFEIPWNSLEPRASKPASPLGTIPPPSPPRQPDASLGEFPRLVELAGSPAQLQRAQELLKEVIGPSWEPRVRDAAATAKAATAEAADAAAAEAARVQSGESDSGDNNRDHREELLRKT